jgi:regulatory protein
LLAHRARSVAEVERRLLTRGHAAAVVTATLALLGERRYLDDEALAARRAEELLLRRGCGPLKVRHELTLRGLADSVVERAIAAVLEDHRPTDLARHALRRHLRGRPLGSAADRARAHRFLAGRGYPDDVVEAVLQEEC